MLGSLRQFIVSWLMRKRPFTQTPMSDFSKIHQEVKPCDVVLVEGRSRVSDVIKMVTQSSWSHAVIVIGRLNEIPDPRLRELVRGQLGDTADDQLVIESELGLGTVVRPLKTYEHEHLRICRPNGLSSGDVQQVIWYCARQLGNPYHVRQVFDLARFLFPWRVWPRRWRSSLFSRHPGNNTHTVCSTMIAEAFGAIHYPILPLVKCVSDSQVQLYIRNPRLCVPRDFDHSPYFDIIKYPFLDMHRYSRKRLQPLDPEHGLTVAEHGLYVSPLTASVHPQEDGG